MNKRTALIKRKTKETDISLKLNIDGKGESKINTGIGFLDHMLELFAFHGFFDLEINAKGDLKVDIHHTNEDIGLCLGEAFKQALKDKTGIKRFGSANVPMEDITANVVVDISGRGFFDIKSDSNAKATKEYSFDYLNHFLESMSKKLGMNLNVKISGSNTDLHTNIEPIFKALGVAMDQATQVDPRRKGIPSTKGVID